MHTTLPAVRSKPDLRRRHPAALPAYLLLSALFYLPQLLGLRAFPSGDFNQHFLPFNLFLRSELLAGRLPIWNPYTYGGHPFLADIQAAVFYPVSNLLLALTLPFADPAARLYFMEVEAALHLALAGYFTYLLVRDLTGQRDAAFLAGMVFAFSGFLTGYAPLQLAMLRTAVWLPLVLWLLLRGLSRQPDQPGLGAWRWTIYAALVYTVAFLAGHPQTFLYLSYTAAAWVVLVAGQQVRRDGAGALRRLIPRVVAFGALFLALSAAQLWPSLEFAALSVRTRVDYEFLSGGLPVRETWQMLLPAALTIWSPLYVGILPLGLALLGTAGAARGWPLRGAARPAAGAAGAADAAPWPARYRPHILFFAGLALVALLLSFGGAGFLYPLFYRWLPGWRLFRDQERSAYLVAFALSVLAGYGLCRLRAAAPAGRRRLALVYSTLVAAGLAIFLAYWAAGGRVVAPEPALWRAVPASLVAAGLIAAWGLLAGRAAGSGGAWSRWATLSLLALAAADLFVTNIPTNLGSWTPAQAVALPPEAQALQAAVAGQDAASSGLPPRVQNDYRIFDDYGMLAGLEEIRGSSPLWLARYAALFTNFPPERLWQLTGTGYVLSPYAALGSPFQILATFPQGESITYLQRLTKPHGRAWLAGGSKTVDDATALALLADRANFNPDKVALLAADEPLAAPAASKGGGKVTLSRLGPAHLLAQVENAGGGWLVIAENWLPGWQATLRQPGAATAAAAPVLRADLTFLAIPVPAGASTIDLAYRPASVRYGLAISGAGLLLLLLLAAAQRLPRRLASMRLAPGRNTEP